LCRQTDLLVAAGKTGKIVNIKKGQFADIGTISDAVEKVGGKTWVTERGTAFGKQLVVDFHDVLSMPLCMILDCTHSVKYRIFAEDFAKLGIVAGVDGIFMEVHDDPDNALCDGDKSVKLNRFEHILTELTQLWGFLHDFR
jgi:2-dehydro-3-deoxyphosphooctonate aldolase (KDO 8-P synthase)